MFIFKRKSKIQRLKRQKYLLEIKLYETNRQLEIELKKAESKIEQLPLFK